MHNAKQQRPPLLIALAVGLTLLMLWPAWTAARNGLSDLYARPAIGYLGQKRFDAFVISPAEWLALEYSVAQADKLMPSNPQYLEALGLLRQLELRLFGDALSVEERNNRADTAAEYFQKAIESRPTWPYYWGNLTLEHYRRGNSENDEYSLALANTARFGPWKNDTQRLVIDLGSDTWDFLSLPAKHELVLSVERGLHRQPQNTIRMLRSHYAWPRICAASKGLLSVPRPHLHALCAQESFSDSHDLPQI